MADDENIKNAEQAVKIAMLQDKAKEFQDKNQELQNKEYSGRYQGVNIVMKGTFEVVSIHIDQGYYETASKGQIELAFTKCLANLHEAVRTDIEDVTKQFQSDILRLQKSDDENY